MQRLRDKGATIHIGHDPGNLANAEVVVVSTAIRRDNPELDGRAGRPPARGSPRRNAGRADAPQALRGHRRHARQDHHHIAGRHTSRRRQVRSDRDQRRHHQRLWDQRAARRRRLDGRRGRRIRRHLPEAAGRRHRRHQHRSRAPRPFRDVRRDKGRVPRLRREHPVLRLRGDVPRPPDRAGAGRPHRGPPRRHLRRDAAGRRAARRRRSHRRTIEVLRHHLEPQDARRDAHRRSRRCRCLACTTR